MAAKKEALAPRLEQLAIERPERAAAVRDVVDNWDTRGERDTYTRAVPLLDAYKADHPDDAASVDSQVASWKRRLDTFAK